MGTTPSQYIRDFASLKFPSSITNCQYLIIGKTGVGKSATGNTLLGMDLFKESAYTNCLNYVTLICQRGRRERAKNFEIEVMDTPGLMDYINPPNWAESIIARSLRLIDYKPDVILYVIKASDRIADIDEKVLNCITNLFGPDCFKYMIVVFTCEDQLDGRSLADCLLEIRDDNRIALPRLLEQVGSRYLTITNSRNLSSRQINEQILELLKMTQKMMVSNNPPYYCPTLPEFDNADQENAYFNEIPLPAPRNSCILS